MSRSCVAITTVVPRSARLRRADAALDAYRQRHLIAERLTRLDPSNVRWQVDLAISYGRLGSVPVLPLSERQAFRQQGRDIVSRLKAAGRLISAEDQIDLSKLDAPD